MSSRPGGPDRLPGRDSTDDVDTEVAEELDAHFRGTIDLLVERGWTEEDARAEALRRFGDVERYRHALEGMGRRRRRKRWVRRAVQDCSDVWRSAVRGVRRSPGLSAAVVLTLALGLGANAAVFRIVDRLLLSPPAQVARASEVRRLYQKLSRAGDEPYAVDAFTYADVRALRASDLPARFAATTVATPETLGEGAGAVRVRVARVDSAYLPLLGVNAALGRAFTPEDHRPDATPVALLGNALWRSRFGADPHVLGTTLWLGNEHVQVVGVLPAGFVGAEPPAVDVWIPLEATAGAKWGAGWADAENILAFHVLARLKSKGSEEALESNAPAVLARSRGNDYAFRGKLLSVDAASLIPGDGPNPIAMVSVSRWVAGVALLVLLVACANVANLFLAQGEGMRREIAVRRALGAGRARITAELLARALLLTLLAAAGAAALASLGSGVLDGPFFSGMELGAPARTGRLLLFVAAAALLAAMLSGLLPALLSSGSDLRQGLRGEGRGATAGSGLRRTLVGVQAALSTLLLVGALLFVQSLRSALRIHLGFDYERLVTVRIEPDRGGDAAALYTAGEEALLRSPGVTSVASTVAVPFQLLYGLSARLPEGDPLPDFTVNAVGPRYFATMGVPVLRGRPIERADLAEGADPVAVVSAAAAKRLWPGREALGQCLVVGRSQTACARVVGVAADHAGTSFSLGLAAGRGMAWVPLSLAHKSPFALLVRVKGDARLEVGAVRRTVLEVPGVRYSDVEPMDTFVDAQFRSWRLGAAVFSLFGLIALGVAAVGLYSVLAYEVARRRREIGIRMALGARRGRLVGRVLGAALITVVAGLAVALPVAAWGAGRLNALLFKVSPRDPAVFALAAGLLLATALSAAALPAWRSTRVDPKEALMEE